MTQIHVDPQALIRFAGELDGEVRHIRQRHEEVRRQLVELRSSGVWSDVTQEEYQRSFDAATKDIEELVHTSKSICQYLEQQAALITRYLKLAQRRI